MVAHADIILELARRSIRHGLDEGRPLAPASAELPAELVQPGAAFVTLSMHAELRGCIGSPLAYRPLAEDVAENAFAAAFRDPRFPPLRPTEWEVLAVSVSVLTTPEPMSFTSEDDLLAQLRPGTDGLIIDDQGARALFLPSVWSQLPEPRSFLGQLKRKAGLPVHHWSAAFTAKRFQAHKIGPGL